MKQSKYDISEFWSGLLENQAITQDSVIITPVILNSNSDQAESAWLFILILHVHYKGVNHCDLSIMKQKEETIMKRIYFLLLNLEKPLIWSSVILKISKHLKIMLI